MRFAAWLAILVLVPVFAEADAPQRLVLFAGDIPVIVDAPHAEITPLVPQDGVTLYIPGMEAWLVKWGCNTNRGAPYPIGGMLIPERHRIPAPDSPLAAGGDLVAAGGFATAGCYGFDPNATIELDAVEKGSGPRRGAFVSLKLDTIGVDPWRPSGVAVLIFNRMSVPSVSFGLPPLGDMDLRVTLRDHDGTLLGERRIASLAEQKPTVTDATGWILDWRRADHEYTHMSLGWIESTGDSSTFVSTFDTGPSGMVWVECERSSGVVYVRGLAANTTIAARAADAPCTTQDLATNEPFVRFDDLERTLYEGLREGVPTWRE